MHEPALLDTLRPVETPEGIELHLRIAEPVAGGGFPAGQVTIEGQSFPLPPPFMTLATQNPIEHEGTNPLPEAQLDRFLLKIQIDYPSIAEETALLRAVTGGRGATDWTCRRCGRSPILL